MPDSTSDSALVRHDQPTLRVATLGRWIGIPEAAKQAGMSESQMRRRLKRLDQISGGRLLRHYSATGRVGRWEVSLDVLKELMTSDLHRRNVELAATHSRLDDLEEGLLALRSAHHAHRRKTKKMLERHSRQIDALRQLSEASAAVVEAFSRE